MFGDKTCSPFNLYENFSVHNFHVLGFRFYSYLGRGAGGHRQHKIIWEASWRTRGIVFRHTPLWANQEHLPLRAKFGLLYTSPGSWYVWIWLHCYLSPVALRLGLSFAKMLKFNCDGHFSQINDKSITAIPDMDKDYLLLQFQNFVKHLFCPPMMGNVFLHWLVI